MPEFVVESQIPSSYSSQTAEQLFEKMHPPASLPFSECLRNQLNEPNVQELNKQKSVSFNLNSSVIGTTIFVYVLKWLHNDTLRPFEHKRF